MDDHTKLSDDGARSAVIFSRELVRKLEGPGFRLPATYIGVRQVRPAGGKTKEAGAKRKRGTTEISCVNTGDVCDEWSPNVICTNIQPAANGTVRTEDITPYPITFKVTNPDGTERRMTAQEKKKLKNEMKQAKQLARKEQKQIEVKERIRIDKEKKRERKKLKLMAKQKRLQNTNDSEEHEQEEHKGTDESNSPTQEDQDEETERKYRGNPPVILTPAGTRVAVELGALYSKTTQDANFITALDDDLAKEWAAQIQVSMVPAEQHRAKEDIRQMPYKLVPEVWKRLRPVSTDRQIFMTDKVDSGPNTDYSTTPLRNSAPSYDDSAYFIFKHLHQHFNLHLACGARFGCDYLLYDGKREEKHSFAGLRIYTATDDSNDMLPLPSAYDMHGFVRAMNTARKLALIATVKRSKDNPNVARVAIVDMALEAILTADTHIRKGNTEKRKCVENTSELKKLKV